jgi:hypothetical protein
MKYYLVLTGATFGLIVLAHVVRVYEEGIQLAKEPSFIITTALAMALCLWALFLLRKLIRGN